MQSRGVSSQNRNCQQSPTTAGYSMNKTIHDEIVNFKHLSENVAVKLRLDNWLVSKSHHNLHIFRLNKKLNGNLSIRNTIYIDIDLVVKVFGEKDDEIFNLKLYRWPQLQTLIDQLCVNVKHENQMNVIVISDDDGNEEPLCEFRVKDEYGIDLERQNEDLLFEFCATNAKTEKPDIHRSTTEIIAFANKEIESFVNVENPILADEATKFHQRPINHDGPFRCSECGKTFDKYVWMMLHSRRHQTKICSLCNERYYGSLERHLRVHHNPDPDYKEKSFECFMCRREYKYLSPLQRHMQVVHRCDAIQYYFCDICKDGRDYITNDRLKRHTRNIHEKVTKKQILPVEQHQFQYVREAEKRILKRMGLADLGDDENATSKIVPGTESDIQQSVFRCTACDKDFPTRKQFVCHMRRHDQRAWKQCPMCDKSYDNLKRHINNTHLNMRNHICHECGAAYSQSSSLKEHIETRHCDDLKFFCDICQNGKSYPSRGYLKRHLAKVHAKVQPKVQSVNTTNRPKMIDRQVIFECQVCNEHLPSKYSLNRHTIEEHGDGGMPFHCTVCDKSFALKSSLRVHEKLHTGKEFICDVCGLSFQHPNYLRKHKRRHEEIKYKECKLCDKRYVQNVDLRLHMKKVHNIDVPVRNGKKTLE